MAKFIQICASQDDLFALDDTGDIYQFNFNTKTWIELVEGRSQEGGGAGQGERGSTSRAGLP